MKSTLRQSVSEPPSEHEAEAVAVLLAEAAGTA